MVVQGVVLRKAPLGGLEVLLVHRSSPRAWEIPGGKPEPCESFPRAVEREVFEEAGLTVRAVRLVGTFWRTGYRPHVSPAYRCELISGEPRPNDEAIAAAFHPVDRLPWGLFPWLGETIELAVADYALSRETEISPPVRYQHLGIGAIGKSLLIHMTGVARIRA